MRASVRHFISPDIDLLDFRPEDPKDFSFLLQALIGPADSEGEESIQFLVCTPRSIERRIELEGIVLGRSLIIVNSPDVKRILDFVKKSIERLELASWGELSSRFARLGIMEFEDFL